MMDPKPIYMLRRGQCRFPITPDEAPSHLFCAEPVEREGVVYCAEHGAICYDRRPKEVRRAHAERAAIARAGLKAETKTAQKKYYGLYASPKISTHAVDEDVA